MTTQQQHVPGAASGATVRKDGEKWTLVMVRELRHPPAKVWAALTDIAQISQWAPYEIAGTIGTGETVLLTWLGSPKPIQAKVTRMDAPNVLELGDIRWELEAIGSGTRLTLTQTLDRRYVAWGAAGWHMAFDVLERVFAGENVQRMAGPAAMQQEGWQRLCAEYAKQFGAEPPKWG